MMDIPTERRIYTISEINREIKNLLETKFQNIWLRGEISNYRLPPSGHCYFTLKDESAQLKAVCFRTSYSSIKFKLEDGLEILARGRITAYEPRGDYQIVVDHIEPVGLGSLQLAFEQLKEKLRMQGLFAIERKRPLPLLPCKIGIVTSPTGAAIRDILRILKRRNKSCHVLIYPTKVQGDGAAKEIAAGIRYMNTLEDIDVLIVGRGGGSIEDLWSFNEEIIATAIFNSRIPVISAVGHEIDFTIADFVADLRAPTPSAAAELVSAAQEELKHRVEYQLKRLMKSLTYLLENRRARLNLLQQTRGFLAFPDKIREHAQRVDDCLYRIGNTCKSLILADRSKFSLFEDRLSRTKLLEAINRRRELLIYDVEHLRDCAENLLKKARKAFEIQSGKFSALSPLAVLARGYSICRKLDGSVVKEQNSVSIGEKVRVVLAKGELNCEVKNVQPDAAHDRHSKITTRSEATKDTHRPLKERADQTPLLFGSLSPSSEEQWNRESK